MAPLEDPYSSDSDCDSYMSGTASSFASESDAWEPKEEYVEKPKRESICVVPMSSISNELLTRFPASEAASEIGRGRSWTVLYAILALMAIFTLVCRHVTFTWPPLTALYC